MRESLRVGIEVARALTHAHTHGVIHRDLKPANVFLCADDQVKVLDFGLSLVFGDDATSGGTAGYMAPEQWRGDPGDARTDLFALGVVLHLLLGGQLPYPPDRAPAGAVAALAVPEAPGAGALVARLLELQPERRPSDAGEVAAALTAILRESERTTPAGAAPRDVRAYEFYLRGRRFLQQTRKASLRFAEEMFGRAIELAPDFALAHAGRAEAAALRNMYYPPEQAELEEAEAASARAVELLPALGEAHAVRGLALAMLKRPDEARRAFERSLELAPGLPEAHYYYARACFQAGQMEEAAYRFREAARAGEHYQAAFFAAQASEALGRHHEALQAYAAALVVLERHMDLNPDDARAATMRAVSLCRLGRRTEGIHWGEQAMLLDPQDAGVRYNVACLLALEGEHRARARRARRGAARRVRQPRLDQAGPGPGLAARSATLQGADGSALSGPVRPSRAARAAAGSGPARRPTAPPPPPWSPWPAPRRPPPPRRRRARSPASPPP